MTAREQHADELRRKLREHEQAGKASSPALRPDTPAAQAMATARRLGHQMAPWHRMDDGSLYAYCAGCNDYLTAHPPRPGRAEVKGPAMVLRCGRR